MANPTLLPTNACFDDALDLITARVLRDPALAHRTSLILVHAICLAPQTGEPYAHAWVEEDGVDGGAEDGTPCAATICWDSGILKDGGPYDGRQVYYSVLKEDYYAARRVQETTRYTIREALDENYRSCHFGPWKAEYRALCGAGTKVFGAL